MQVRPGTGGTGLAGMRASPEFQDEPEKAESTGQVAITSSATAHCSIGI